MPARFARHHALVLTAAAWLLITSGIGPARAAADGGIAADAGIAADGGVATDAAGPAPEGSPTPALDAVIDRRLRAAFATIETLRDVEVSVFGGVVTLRGTVPTARARESATAVAGRIDGVLFVQDQVSLETTDEAPPGAGDRSQGDEAITAQLRAIYDNAPDLAAVTVAVSRGVARLGGSAPTEQAIESAEKVAAGLSGVVYVSNGVTLDLADVGDRVGPVVSKLREQGRHTLELVPILGIALLVFLLFYVVARALRSWDRPFQLISKNMLARSILRQFVFAVILIIGLLLALEIAGATAVVGAVLGTAGVLGLALGFALQDIVQNYISGVMLSIRQPFEPKDLVQIGDHQGVIIRLTTRETLLMTTDGNHLRIPNSTVFGATLINYSRNPERRFDFAVGVGTAVDLVAAQALGLDILREMPGVLDEPKPSARIEELGDSSVILRFYGWVDQKHSDFGKTRSVAIRRLKVAFDEAGIEMPVPGYHVDLVTVSAAAEAEAEAREPSPPTPAASEVAAADDVSVERVIEDKINAERAEDREDLLSTPK